MDIIAEILETDSLAEEKLAEAREQSSRLIAAANVERDRLARQCTEDCESYAEVIRAENSDRLAKELESINARKDAELSGLEALFEKNGEKWAEEIFARMTTVK
ncbi:MAG: hypothetical protein IKN17_06535 [Ruminococcus sp.]|nr:hypothetical protein [Ruminococcus sp.]